MSMGITENDVGRRRLLIGPWRGMGPGLRARWEIVRLAFAERPPAAVTAIALIVAIGVQGTALRVANGFLIGALPPVIDEGFASRPGRSLLVALGVMGGLYILGHALPAALRELTRWLGQRVDMMLRTRMLLAVSRPPGIAHLEDPGFADSLSQATGMGAWFTPGLVVPGIASLTATRLDALGSVILVALYSPALSAALVVVHVVTGAYSRQRYLVLGRVVYGQTQRVRRSDYLHGVAMTDAPKEIRIFGLGAWIRDRFTEHYLGAMDGIWRERRMQDRYLVWAVPLLAAVDLGAFALIARDGVTGAISLTEVAILVSAVMGVGQIAGITTLDTTQVEYGSQAFPKVLDVEARSATSFVVGREAEGMPREAIRVEDLSFRYPGREEDVYSGLDLEIPAGRSLALVGANGAGKTTLVKLLARLYEPTGGSITVDGLDLAELDPPSWQRQVAAIFQDFAQYQLSFADNVGFGALGLQDEGAAFERAVRRAGATAILDRLPAGADTVLSRQYTDGVDLSGGEWQRVALARALFAVEGGARLLILDEPTASLDVRLEAELFDRFLELTHGVTTILISHRFSTVRHAERICVIDGGRITELGSHDDLIAADGRYAEMFRLQASRFEGGVDA